jgi:hypothetical protein
MRAMAPKGPALQRCCNARGQGPLLQASQPRRLNPVPATNKTRRFPLTGLALFGMGRVRSAKNRLSRRSRL